ncbi:HAMP domain-containing sensor histidine kinase [Paenibacillus sp. XY044]|uniref:sensor histidine kinase n=1 Tax=Paenibacillus sp. XY044 TaxID=2026089 RepID=UPI000B97E4C5|nr:HAMP domain-containing sensor histidine kinase [Paenibacillus sp. XY044]OZB92378.1 two-component sensor histidine kinase [Paenibacillus sp. XY044]
MKLWQKIYLLSLLVFVLIFNGASVMVIERTHNRMLNQTIEVALSQNMSIHSSVDAIVPILRIYDSLDYEKTVLTSMAKQFVAKNSGQGIYLDITDDASRTIFNNADFGMPQARRELENLDNSSIHYILRDVGDRTILFTVNNTQINQKKYVFTYMKDLTPVYQDRIEQYGFFAKVDSAACILFMIVMFFVSRGLTRSIERLNRTSQIIAQGNFSERVKVKSRDEIGILGSSFNEMAEVVEDKINELERNNDEKQRFIDNFTHELKTPLTSIVGYANFLRTTKYNEKLFLDALGVIYDEGKRLEALSLKLMDLIMLKKVQFQMERQEMRALLLEMKPTLEIMAKEKEVNIKLDCQEGRLELERDLIKVLVFNLVDNALKASIAGGTVTLRTYWREAAYVLAVIDQGIGIAEEHLDKIFEPFYMADKARTRNSNGAGLGLALCGSIADIHHAVIRVSSQVQQGTTIEVVFAAEKRGGGPE